MSKRVTPCRLKVYPCSKKSKIFFDFFKKGVDNSTNMLYNNVVVEKRHAVLAQLDRVFGYEPKGRGFESLTPYQKNAYAIAWAFFVAIVLHSKTHVLLLSPSDGALAR